MALRPPNLDDRSFDDLVEEAQRLIRQRCPKWTDLSPSDPGVVLLEVFAHLTEIMLYRLNRLPEKAYIEFLRLIGVQVQPPAAAVTTLAFRLSRAQNRPLEIPRGTRVSTKRSAGGSEPPVFVTAETVTIAPGGTEAQVAAYHCEVIDGEQAGFGTGLPGLVVRASRPPIVAPMSDGLDLIVGVEAKAGGLGGGISAVQYEGKAFRIWREVRNFSNLGADRFVYVADRLTGTVQFAPAMQMKGEHPEIDAAPAALAEVPAAGSEIRLWYRRGGGASGNVTANMLTTFKDTIPGVEVTNPIPATGGRSAETIENALLRGPQELHSLQRAVTARDFELRALRSPGAVDRAKAFTRAKMWAHAQPGTVEVVLVPHLPDELRSAGWITAETVRRQETGVALEQIRQELDRRRPLGTTCIVSWANYKTVRVKARIRVQREENPVAVKARVLRRLWQTITPLSDAESPGWPFGQPLTAWDIYKVIGSEPGVISVDQVRLAVEEAPDTNVKTVEADAFQPHAWYAGSGETVFRSLNDGDSWERVGHFPGEEVRKVKAYPREASQGRLRAGLVAVFTRLPGDHAGSRLYLSRDCGETWEEGRQTEFDIEDIAWIDREGVPSLLLATERGLYELAGRAGAGPIQIVVEPAELGLGFYAVAVSTDPFGQTSVAVAGRGERGIYLSSNAGKPNTFVAIGLGDELVRVLAVQRRGAQHYLWAGVAAVGDDPGKGCFRWSLTGSAENPEGWQPFRKNWQAGGCHALAFQGSRVLAASLRRGVLRLDMDARDPQWESPDVGCGLPLRDVGRLQPVDAVASNPEGGVLLAAGVEGIYRSNDQGIHYADCSGKEFSETVDLPDPWLFCSGEHQIEVVSEDDETKRD